MFGRIDHLGGERSKRAGWTWLSRLAVAWIVGIVLAAQWPNRWVLFAGALAALSASVWLMFRRCGRAAYAAGLVALALVGGAWFIVQRDYVPADHVSRFVHEEPAIAGLRGTVASIPREVKPDQGTFGAFSFEKPGTLFELEIEAADAGGGFEPASGSMLVRLKRHDHRPVLGQRIEVLGWMSAIGPTQNPGEFDYRAYLQRQGISGRISLMGRGNWRALGPPPRWAFTGLRRVIGDASARSLRLGMPEDEAQQALLDALLLGRRTGEMQELSDSFRAVGLSHVLSISGAHLGILLFLVWALGRLMIGRPSVVTAFVLAVLVLFLLAVPWRTPIIRAAIMAAVFCFGYGFGRRLTGVQVLSVATLIVLIWKPTELFSAGFQLSFGVVGAILLFGGPVSRRVMPEPEVKIIHPSAWDLLMRWLVDFFAVSLVAFAVALPMVMFHFQLISPLAVLLSMLALPVLTAVLAVGYLKMLVGLVSPAAGSLLSVPMAWVGDSLSALVVQAQRWPGSSFTLPTQPSIAWTLSCSALVVALLSGLFGKQRIALILCTLLVCGWGWLEQRPRSVMDGYGRPALVLNMFAVGDGSCFLIRSGDETLMFDCGSQGYWRIGRRSIVPALNALSVPRIDTLMLSHADLDHFVGVLDVLDAVAVGRVLVSPDVLREAEANPRGAAAYLVQSIRERGYEPVPVEQGWSMTMGDATLELLWPAPGYVSEKNNNNSLVLAIESAGRRVLLNGDIQDDAIRQLLGSGALLKADVTDLAHHGSFVDASPDWLEAVGPGVVLQSAGPRRDDEDRWAVPLKQAGIRRMRTTDHGMVELRITSGGKLMWSTHRATVY
ncbi:MAG: ComEC/Rec2 family competence protein [Phycisphaeraceae bacterium]|nr:ComEC/Rec2 family competence protein [Phycisphaeraceae bacterium]